jgi:hypothetical protein
MTLSDHDLTQLNTSYLDTLPEDNLRSLSKKLLVDLKEARERLNWTPETSSVPRHPVNRGKAQTPKRRLAQPKPLLMTTQLNRESQERRKLKTAQHRQTPQKPPIQRLSQPRKRGGNQGCAQVVKVIVASLPWKSPEYSPIIQPNVQAAARPSKRYSLSCMDGALRIGN